MHLDVLILFNGEFVGIRGDGSRATCNEAVVPRRLGVSIKTRDDVFLQVFLCLLVANAFRGK
jgi:hypothetical protein